jgi:hypothetical protein
MRGFCPICENEVIFTANNEWLRDHYLCSSCGSIPMERSIMQVIQQKYPNWRELCIHELNFDKQHSHKPKADALPIIKKENRKYPICEKEAVLTTKNSWLRDNLYYPEIALNKIVKYGNISKKIILKVAIKVYRRI